jgi:hypothetical protein
MISACLKHDSILEPTFKQPAVKFVENMFVPPLKKKFTYLVGLQPNKKQKKCTCHTEDFVLPTEWIFFVMSHWKNACVGGW